MKSRIIWRSVVRGSALTSSRKSQSLSSSPMTSTWWLMASMGKRSMGRGMEWLERSAAKGGCGGLHSWAGCHRSGLTSSHYSVPFQGGDRSDSVEMIDSFLGTVWIKLLWLSDRDHLSCSEINYYSLWCHKFGLYSQRKNVISMHQRGCSLD